MANYINNQKAEADLNTEIRKRLNEWRHSCGSRAVVCERIGAKETTLKNWEKGYRQVNVLAILVWHRNGFISTEERDFILFGHPTL